MSSKDKTREKLMGSIRKTKAGAGTGSRSEPDKTSASQASVSRSAKSIAKRASRVTSDPQSRTISPDAYESGRRVWPD